MKSETEKRGRERLYLQLGLGAAGLILAYVVLDGVLGSAADLTESQTDLEMAKNFSASEIAAANLMAAEGCVDLSYAQAEKAWDDASSLALWKIGKNRPTWVSDEAQRIMDSTGCIDSVSVG
jgi:hypothetical protein